VKRGPGPTDDENADDETNMAIIDDKKEDAIVKADDPVPAEDDTGASVETEDAAGDAAGGLGAAKYVHAAFFFAAILAAYVSAKVLVMGWGALADWPDAVRKVPQLVQYDEDKRENIAFGLGATISIVGIIQVYRKERVRNWADEVAAELTRVTWPTRETVMNGTLVVVVASAIATFYVTILDRFWSFLTTLVYGA
jgi:preprotein translocase subunit SecE